MRRYPGDLFFMRRCRVQCPLMPGLPKWGEPASPASWLTHNLIFERDPPRSSHIGIGRPETVRVRTQGAIGKRSHDWLFPSAIDDAPGNPSLCRALRLMDGIIDEGKPKLMKRAIQEQIYYTGRGTLLTLSLVREQPASKGSGIFGPASAPRGERRWASLIRKLRVRAPCRLGSEGILCAWARFCLQPAPDCRPSLSNERFSRTHSPQVGVPPFRYTNTQQSGTRKTLYLVMIAKPSSFIV